MLISLEMDITHAMTKLILPHLIPTSAEKGGTTIITHAIDGSTNNNSLLHYANGKSTVVLNDIFSSSSSKSKNLVSGIDEAFSSVQETDGGAHNPLYFSWNDGPSSSKHLQVSCIGFPSCFTTSYVRFYIISLFCHVYP